MDLSHSDESKVLIIYTGGTIGMLVGQRGYVPEPYFLTETFRSQTRFHDPFQESLFSNATSVEGFRQWSSNNGRSSPTAFPSSLPAHLEHRSTLLVRNRNAKKVADDVYEAHLPAFVTPPTIIPGGSAKRIRYAVLEWHPLLDSSNIEIDDWIRMATEIELNYSLFDAFVILHGTDTMAYTSSALSFLLEDLGKTVILTGAQIPLSQLRNDAVDNLLGALSIAGHYIIPVGIDIVVNWNDVIRQTSLQRFRAHKEMSQHVAALRLFPGITAATVRAFLAPSVKGVVLETFGAGNAPQRTDLMLSLREACDRGVVIVAITQCAKGSVSDAYETGRTLLQAGVVPGGDMTPEVSYLISTVLTSRFTCVFHYGKGALAKLSYLLSKPELSPAEVRSLIGIPLRGELTRPKGTAPRQPTLDQNIENIESVLYHVVRLSSAPSAQTPKIIVSSDNIDEAAKDAAAPWSSTAAEAASMELALFSALIHLAAAADDVDGVFFCLASEHMGNDTLEARKYRTTAGGIVNWLNPASGRSPLHVAAINGSLNCVGILLEGGALVHLRDALGHTALYYASSFQVLVSFIFLLDYFPLQAARQGHDAVVETLLKAGANLGGADVQGGFAALAMENAYRAGDERALNIWVKADAHISNRQEIHRSE
ncbi:hypothetical protein EW146_g3638 [Bondarzewia mesenterica]|uniref:asparaginase n=1 Tax=Bondarzewia mesenterica TaxID=1095465 RepID=A0A4S4LYF3_9AGAM|nr:hypothetical protein EW146_g3638 [Bondarzewia mesenterica]